MREEKTITGYLVKDSGGDVLAATGDKREAQQIAKNAGGVLILVETRTFTNKDSVAVTLVLEDYSPARQQYFELCRQNAPGPNANLADLRRYNEWRQELRRELLGDD